MGCDRNDKDRETRGPGFEVVTKDDMDVGNNLPRISDRILA